jgi:hypothetical protein
MDSSDLPKPWLYKNKWIVWPETALDAMTISNCRDTVSGICETGKTLNDCIDQCKISCALGYHIEFENGKTICSSIKNNDKPFLNPIHRLKKKDTYPELSKVKISTFINTDVFPFPPEEANVVFFKDILNIKEQLSGTSIKAGSSIKTDEHHDLIYLGNDGKHNLQFLQSLTTSVQIEKYIPVRYGSEIQIATPGTSLLASVSYGNKLSWKSISGIFYTNETTFQLIPLDPTKKFGDIVTYDDVFAITYGNRSSVVVMEHEGEPLQLVSGNIENILNNKKYTCKFSLKSKMLGYYCDGRECKPVPIKDMQTIGTMGRYKDVTVGRDPNCWGVCKYLKLGTNDTEPLRTNPPSVSSSNRHKTNFLLIGILSMIFIFILSTIIIVRTRKKRSTLFSFDVLSPPPYFGNAF